MPNRPFFDTINILILPEHGIDTLSILPDQDKMILQLGWIDEQKK
jgi:hypothetical protein